MDFGTVFVVHSSSDVTGRGPHEKCTANCPKTQLNEKKKQADDTRTVSMFVEQFLKNILYHIPPFFRNPTI